MYAKRPIEEKMVNGKIHLVFSKAWKTTTWTMEQHTKAVHVLYIRGDRCFERTKKVEKKTREKRSLELEYLTAMYSFQRLLNSPYSFRVRGAHTFLYYVRGPCSPFMPLNNLKWAIDLPYTANTAQYMCSYALRAAANVQNTFISVNTTMTATAAHGKRWALSGKNSESTKNRSAFVVLTARQRRRISPGQMEGW